MMQKHFDILRATRRNYLKQLKGVSLKNLNFIPEGYNNNLIWNAAHAVVTQQLLCYALSGVEVKVPKDIIANYRKGTKPDKDLTQKEVHQVKEWLDTTADWMEADFKAGLFKNYSKYRTSYGTTLDSIETAIIFNNVHESMHLGYMIALKKHLKV